MRYYDDNSYTNVGYECFFPEKVAETLITKVVAISGKLKQEQKQENEDLLENLKYLILVKIK